MGGDREGERDREMQGARIRAREGEAGRER